MPSSLVVKTSVYEGPLDLLLELIEKRKLLINDISLATVTDEYITKIQSMEELPMGETAEFISLAATLLLIKSRSLLPTLELSDEETQDIKELEYRLAVYQIVKESAKEFSKNFKLPMLHESEGRDPEPLFHPDATITLPGLLAAARALIDGFPQALTLPKVEVKKVVSLEEMIDSLSKRVTTAMRLSFRDFSGIGTRHKPDVIVSFLALLELVKQGIIKATQEEKHGDITLENDAVSTPSYE